MDNVLTALQFHARRLLTLLRRSSGSVQARGWQATLRRFGATGNPVPKSAPTVTDPRHPDNAVSAPHVLIVDVAAPCPDRDSGSLRLVNLMRLLVREGYRVTFAADDGSHAGPRVHALHGIGVETISTSAVGWLGAHGKHLDSAILCRHHVAGHWLPLIRKLAPAAHVVFDTVDLHFLREQREAGFHRSPRLRRRAATTRKRELGLVARADTTWVVSETERALLREQTPDARILVLSNIIDTVAAGHSFQQRSDLLFVGGHRHPPNTDAVLWLILDIFPRVRQQLPGIVLHMVGGDVPETVVRAVRATEGIELHGHVPDLLPYLDGCRVAVAPLRFGAGVKGKINLSMAHGQPVVTTTCGAEGMHLRAGHDAMVADDAEGIVRAVVRLHEDQRLWEQLAENALANVREHFSFEAATGALVETFGRASATRLPRGRNESGQLRRTDSPTP